MMTDLVEDSSLFSKKFKRMYRYYRMKGYTRSEAFAMMKIRQRAMRNK